MRRVLTALVLIPLVLAIVIWGHAWLVFAVVALCAMICYREYCGMAAGYGAKKMGGGCFSTVIIFIILWYILGHFGVFK